MNFKSLLPTLLICAAINCAISVAQTPAVTVDPQRNGNLAAAQGSIAQAFAKITDAQRDNASHLGGHAEKAKELSESGQ